MEYETLKAALVRLMPKAEVTLASEVAHDWKGVAVRVNSSMAVELEDGTTEVRSAQLVYTHQLNGQQRMAHAEPDHCLDTEAVVWFIGSPTPKIVKLVPNS